MLEQPFASECDKKTQAIVQMKFYASALIVLEFEKKNNPDLMCLGTCVAKWLEFRVDAMVHNADHWKYVSSID